MSPSTRIQSALRPMAKIMSSMSRRPVLHPRYWPVQTVTATAISNNKVQHRRNLSNSPISQSDNIPSYLSPIPISQHIDSPPPQILANPIPELARRLVRSLKSNTQISRVHDTYPTLKLDQATAYLTAAAILHRRATRHQETPVGRKLGFTNRNIWAEYDIDTPNWSYVYDSTVFDISSSSSSASSSSSSSSSSSTTASQDPLAAVITHDLSALSNLQPRIEPELVLGLRRDFGSAGPPRSTMSDEELLGCVAWIAPAFEVVVSPFADWRFTAAETTAAFALHGHLLIGRRVATTARLLPDLGAQTVLRQLETFRVTLRRNSEVVDDTGVGANVLGSPIRALRFLCALLENDPVNPGLQRGGEIVTTGTLTRALPINSSDDGELWEMSVDGLGKLDGDGGGPGDGGADRVRGLSCRFVY